MLAFKGDVYVAVSSKEQTVNGDLAMIKWWYNVLGTPFVHIGDVNLGVGFDVKTLVPVRMEIGGQVCFDRSIMQGPQGRRQHCSGKGICWSSCHRSK